MDEPPSHPVMIVGLGYGGRAQYIARHVSIGDPVDLRLEADNPYDPLTISRPFIAIVISAILRLAGAGLRMRSNRATGLPRL